ncbi:hypothetical protein ACS5PN_03615 [Roseateles sp. NT4]|uniref:hypothetical protein n=1 Tax=Roseateles sp. NT4 TaxID=3453715 RepID=UPI003EE9A386
MATSSQPPMPSRDGDGEPDEAAAPGPLHAALDHASQLGADATSSLREGIASARETLTECAEELRDMTQERIEIARSNVRARPLVAVATAFALGMLVGRLCR